MAGGIGGRPFKFNTKCVVISGMLGAGYWFLPQKNYFVLGGVLLGSYIGVAWYDELYNCEERLEAGTFLPLDELTAWLKPEVVDGRYGAMRGCSKCKA